MMASYVQCGQFPEACLLFKRMLRDVSDVKPDNVTFANVLVATAEQLAFEEGRIVHAHIIGSGLEHDLLVGNSLINMYSKCGNMQMARIEFNKLSKRDVVSWNALMAGYGQHGEGEQALHLLQEMQMYGNAPNEVTFLSILSSCDHSGLVDEANRCFASMEELYQVRPFAGHYNVLVNLLGRAGRLEDAREIIKEMPMDPVATTWMGLLGACRKHRDLRRGIESASHVFSLDALYDAAFVTLSNLQIECDANMHE
jgi:pentatricopeptide repeat protein